MKYELIGGPADGATYEHRALKAGIVLRVPKLSATKHRVDRDGMVSPFFEQLEYRCEDESSGKLKFVGVVEAVKGVDYEEGTGL